MKFMLIFTLILVIISLVLDRKKTYAGAVKG